LGSAEIRWCTQLLKIEFEKEKKLWTTEIKKQNVWQEDGNPPLNGDAVLLTNDQAFAVIEGLVFESLPLLK